MRSAFWDILALTLKQHSYRNTTFFNATHGKKYTFLYCLVHNALICRNKCFQYSQSPPPPPHPLPPMRPQWTHITKEKGWCTKGAGRVASTGFHRSGRSGLKKCTDRATVVAGILLQCCVWVALSGKNTVSPFRSMISLLDAEVGI